MNKLLELLLLVVILLTALFVRLYKIDTPLADWHSWRQTDTASVSRSFYQEGFNPFLPRYNDMSGVAQDPVPNPGRYRLVEFPIYNSLVYLGYLINGGVDEQIARFVTILFSLGSIIFVYLISRRHFGNITGLLSAVIFAFLPFNVFYSRVVLPEATGVFFSLGMFYFGDLWICKETRRGFWLAVVFGALAFLTKPFALFYLLPLLHLYYQREGQWWPIPKRYLWYLTGIFFPIVAWRLWILQHPEGIPASNWLFNGTGIRLRPAFFRWIVGDRFGREILGVAGTFLFTIGLLFKPRFPQNWMLHLFALSLLSYLVVFATGNVQHDYYQVALVPALAIFVARGFILLIQGLPSFLPRFFLIPLSVLLLVLTFYLTWNEVKGLYQINNGVIVEAGERADAILPKEAVVIAPYNGDTTFLYHTNRPGWANVSFPIAEMIDRFGVTHYVSVNYDDQTNEFIQKYETVEKTDKYVILDLRVKRVDKRFALSNKIQTPRYKQ